MSYFWLETIMEIRSRHIGNQERPGLPALLSSPFRGAVFLWQLANMFPVFATNDSHATGVIGYLELLNYIQLPKLCIFARRITTRSLLESIWKLLFLKARINRNVVLSKNSVNRVLLSLIKYSLYNHYRKIHKMFHFIKVQMLIKILI